MRGVVSAVAKTECEEKIDMIQFPEKVMISFLW